MCEFRTRKQDSGVNYLVNDQLGHLLRTPAKEKAFHLSSSRFCRVLVIRICLYFVLYCIFAETSANPLDKISSMWYLMVRIR